MPLRRPLTYDMLAEYVALWQSTETAEGDFNAAIRVLQGAGLIRDMLPEERMVESSTMLQAALESCRIELAKHTPEKSDSWRDDPLSGLVDEVEIHAAQLDTLRSTEGDKDILMKNTRGVLIDSVNYALMSIARIDEALMKENVEDA